MSSGYLFLKTLKGIGYPEADSLEDSDFEWMFSEKELIPFFDVFCTVNEANVLTAEEIEEYAALTSEELEEIEILRKSKQLENCIDYDKKKEICFLKEHLSYIENHNKALERQIELFKNHEEDLLEEKEIRQKVLLGIKKKFQAYEMSLIPQAEDEFVSSLKSILNFIKELESLMLCTDDKESKIPSSDTCKDAVKQYLENEEKISESIRTFLCNNFQLKEKDYTLSFINSEISDKEELQKEVSLLQQMLTKKMKDAVISDMEIKKIEKIMKNYTTIVTLPEFNCHPSQQRVKLNEVLKINEKLRKKEEDLKKYTVDVITKYVDAQSTQLALSATTETIHHIQDATEKLMQPMNMLLQQRARLETLLIFLSYHTVELQNLKKNIEKILNQVSQEQLLLQKRQVNVENEITKGASKKSEQDPENSLFLYLYKILATIDESRNLTTVSLEDLVQKADKYLNAKENFKRKDIEKLKTIEEIEKHAVSMKTLLNCSDKDYTNWRELEQISNAELNNLEMKLTSLETNISECNQNLVQKQKVLERKGNLRLARNLYVYALMKKDLFEKYIKDIKEAVSNSADYKP